MTVGLPGVGLSGLFLIASAVFIPLDHLLRGNRAHDSPRRARNLFLLALLILPTSFFSWEAITFLQGVTGTSKGGSRHLFVPVTLSISLAILLAIVGVAELIARFVPARLTPTPPPITPRSPEVYAPPVNEMHAAPAWDVHPEARGRRRRLPARVAVCVLAGLAGGLIGVALALPTSNRPHETSALTWPTSTTLSVKAPPAVSPAPRASAPKPSVRRGGATFSRPAPPAPAAPGAAAIDELPRPARAAIGYHPAARDSGPAGPAAPEQPFR